MAFQLLDSAIVIKPSDPKAAKILCEEALKILETNLSPADSLLIDPYMTMGNIYDDLSQYDQSLEFHHKSLSILQKSSNIDAFTLGAIYNNLGNVYGKMGDYTQGVAFMKKSELQYRGNSELKYKKKHSSVFGNLGVAYRTAGKTEESLIYQKQAIDLLETITDTATINTAINYVNYGVSLGDVGRFNEAL